MLLLNMKPLSELTKEILSPIKLISFDSDGVLAQKGTGIVNSPGFYSQKTNPLNPEVIKKLAILTEKYQIVINSGRNSLYLTEIYRDILSRNVTLISEVGIFLTGDGFVVQTEPLNTYELETIKKIRTELANLIGDPRVKGFEPKQFLTTLHCHQEVPEVLEIVKKYDPQNRFYCWWNEEAYDINSSKFTKVNALKKLISLKNILPNQVLSVGNGINDRDSVTSQFLNITTDPKNLITDDFFVEGEHLGGIQILDHLLTMVK